MAMHKRFK